MKRSGWGGNTYPLLPYHNQIRIDNKLGPGPSPFSDKIAKPTDVVKNGQNHRSKTPFHLRIKQTDWFGDPYPLLAYKIQL